MKTYDLLAANIAAVEKMGAWIARSQMFGNPMNEAQGCIIAMDCFVTGMPILEYQKRNMLVSGRPSIPYDAMIAAFQEAGGKLKVIEKSPEAARIELTFEGVTTPFSLTWVDIQKEPLPYAGKEAEVIKMLAAGKKPVLKPKYATPRSRAIMIFARVISDGIRTVAARVNFGSYTPEEIEDIDSAEPPQSSATGSSKTGGKSVVQTIQRQTLMEIAEATSENTPQLAASGEASEPDRNGPATEDQRQKILGQMGVLKQQGVSDIGQRVVAKLESHGIKDGLLGLTYGEATSLFAALENKEMEVFFEQSLSGWKKEASQGNG